MKNTNVPFNVLRHNNHWERAPRDPVTIGTFIITGLGGSAALAGTAIAFGATFAGIVGYVAISLVTSAVLGALAPKPDFGGIGNDSGQLLSNGKNALSPAQFVYGQTRKGGTVTFVQSGGNTNKILHQIIVIAAHEVEEIGDIYFNDQIVTMSNENVTSSPYNGFAKIYKHLGNQTSQDDAFANSTATLTSTLKAETDVDISFIGKGLAYIYCRFTYDQDAYTEGLPVVTVVVKGKKVVKTISGVDQAAAYSNNAAWCIKDFLESNYGLSDSSINDATFEAAAAVCDDTTVLSDGTPQFTMNGVIGGNETIGGTLRRMMTTCGGTLFWGAGSWRLYAGEFIAPTKTLTLDDFRSGINLDTKVSMRDNFNAVRGTFIESAEDYISTDYPQVGSSIFLTDDNNVETVLDLNLPFTTNSLAAQRIAKQMLYRSREQLTLSADFGMNAFDVEVGDFIKVRNERYGWGTGYEKTFEVTGWKLQPDPDTLDLRVNLTLRESSQAAFGFTTLDEKTIISNNTTLLKYYEVPSIGITIGQVYREVNENVVNALTVNVTSSDLERIDSIILKHKKTSDANFTSSGKTIMVNEGDSAGRFEIVGIKAPQIDEAPINYTVSVIPVNALGFKGAEVTSNFNVTADTVAPAAPSSLSHILSGGTIFFEWPAVAELDLSHYKLYYSSDISANFSDFTVSAKVQKIARPATSITYPALAGKFFLTSIDKTGNESTTQTPAIVYSSELPQLGVTDTDTENPAFDGGKTNVTESGNKLFMSSYAASGSSGVYDFYHEGTSYFDVGTSRTVRISASVTASRKHFDSVAGEVDWDDIPNNWDTWPGDFNDWTNEETNFGDFAVLIQARASDTVSGLSSEVYVEATGELVGQYIEFRATLSNSSAKVTPNITALSATVEY
jgi:hypothetical protein